MKKITLVLLSGYQLLISPFIHAATGTVHACRYPITCSEYTRQVIIKYGVLRGSLFALKRFLSCNPFAKVTPHQV